MAKNQRQEPPVEVNNGAQKGTKKTKRWKLVSSEVSQLSQKVEVLAADITKSKEKLVAIEGFSTAITQRVESVRNDLATNSNRVLTLTKNDSKIGALSEELAEYKHEMESGRKDTALQLAKVESLEIEFASISRKVGSFENELSRANQNVVTLSKELVTDSKRIDTTEGDIVAIKSRAEVLENEVRARNRMIETLEKNLVVRLEGIESDLSSNNRRMETLASEITSKDSRVEKLLGDVSSGDQKIDALEKEIIGTRNHLGILEDGLAIVTRRIEALESNGAMTMRRIQTVEKDLADGIDTLNRRIETVEKEVLLKPRVSVMNGRVNKSLTEESKSESKEIDALEAFTDNEDRI